MVGKSEEALSAVPVLGLLCHLGDNAAPGMLRWSPICVSAFFIESILQGCGLGTGAHFSNDLKTVVSHFWTGSTCSGILAFYIWHNAGFQANAALSCM